MRKLILLPVLLGVGFAGCTAPHGQRLAVNQVLPPVAVGPSTKATKAATLTLANNGELVNLSPHATVTVKLPANGRNGYEWRLSEVPDPTVLELASQEIAPAETPTASGEETMIFKAAGPGDARVKMWYGTPTWMTGMEVRTYEFTAAVGAAEPPAKKKSHKHSAKH
jgi:predicted secreted protein